MEHLYQLRRGKKSAREKRIGICIANQHLTEEERRQVAKSMCHDPNTAERFYIALPDNAARYKSRQLRVRALERAVESPSRGDEGNSDEEESFRDEQFEESNPSLYSNDSPETSSDVEQPILDDRTDSASSLSSDELRIIRRRHERHSHGHGEASSLSGADLPSFQPPESHILQSKKRLDFSPKSRQSGLQRTTLHVNVYTPSKCFVTVDKLSQPIADYYFHKMNATHSLPSQSKACQQTKFAEPKCVAATGAEQSVRFMAAPTAEEEPGCHPEPENLILERQTPEGMPDTPAVDNTGCDPEPRSPQSPECVQETPAVENTGCDPEPRSPQSPECVQETPAVENTGCDPEPQSPQSPEWVQEAPPVDNTGCDPEPRSPQSPECVQETPAVENTGCDPEPQIPQNPEYVQETPAERMPVTPTVESLWNLLMPPEI